MKIYVGNLPFDTTEDELSTAFSAYGKVTSVAVPYDRLSGRPKGFAFLEMAEKSEAEAAIAGLNGKMFKDRTIVVNESRPRTDRGSGSRSAYDNRRGGYGGGYGSGRGGRPGGSRGQRY